MENTKEIRRIEKEYGPYLKKLGIKTEKELKENKIKFMQTLKSLLANQKIAG